ncbi:MAG: DNA polymerase [Thermoproteota archaeon]
MREHYIKRNKRNSTPSKILFYDTETHQRKQDNKTIHTLKLGVARYVEIRKNQIARDKYYVFHTPEEFWNIVEKLSEEKKRLWLIAHNQHFDFNVVNGFEELGKRGWKLEKIVMETDIFFLTYRKKNKTLLIVDSMNYFKTSIEEMGKQIGIPKLKVDFQNVADEKLLEYCKRDVEILSEYFLRFLKWWRENNLGNFSKSVAGLAFNSFKHRFLKHKILVHFNQEAIQLELESYRGGRNECFFLGEVNEKIYKLDVNSMYPFVMRYNPYPIKLRKILTDVTVDKLRILLERYLGIADVYIETDEPAYGIKRNKLIFPIGSFRAVLTTPELKYALEHNHIKKIYKVALYDPGYIFKDYVDYFYNIKLEAEKQGDKLTRNFAKLMMNSLYGKFGQRVRELTEITYPTIMKYGSITAVDLDTQEKYKIYFINGKPYKLEKTHKLFYDGSISIASHVTAYARMYLYFLMKTAGLDNVYYTDTDSLFVNQRGFENLKPFIGEQLGFLKIEGETDNLIIYGLKDYRFGNERKIKGVKPESPQIADNIYLVETWHRTKTLITKGYTGQVITENRVKILQRTYDKGIVTETGRVKPLVLKE